MCVHEKRPRFKSSREIVVDEAAKVIREAARIYRSYEYEELAEKLETLKLPNVDGGPSLHVGTGMPNGWSVEVRSYQGRMTDDERPYFLRIW